MSPSQHSQISTGPTKWFSWSNSLGTIPTTFWMSVLGPLTLLMFSYVAWCRYGGPALDKAMYALKRENLILTPPPPWIKSDIAGEVYEGSNLSRISVTDHQTAATIHAAFRSHPWIRRVINVGKFSGTQIKVNVEYREPVAMIYWGANAAASQKLSNNRTDKQTDAPAVIQTGGNFLESQIEPTSRQSVSDIDIDSKRLAWFVPVDADGVLLPRGDFSPDEVLQYWLIYAKNVSTSGKAGKEYGDARVKAALLLCNLLKSVREPLGLERVYVYSSSEFSSYASDSKWFLELTSKNNKRFVWGNPPGMESSGEASAHIKIDRLAQLMRKPTAEQSTQSEFDLTAIPKANGTATPVSAKRNK